VQDLLTVKDDLITFQSDGKGGRHETKALLNDGDALWVEFRHQHIAKVSHSLTHSVTQSVIPNVLEWLVLFD
jgi:hypothetical protein